MKTIPGSITISRPSFSSDKEAIRIELTSETSRVRFATFEMPLDEFARALTGLGWAKGTIELVDDLSIATKFHEYKHEVVHSPFEDLHDREKEWAEKVKALEVDGWKAYWPDVKNHHNWIGRNSVSVGFHRYVNKEPTR